METQRTPLPTTSSSSSSSSSSPSSSSSSSPCHSSSSSIDSQNSIKRSSRKRKRHSKTHSRKSSSRSRRSADKGLARKLTKDEFSRSSKGRQTKKKRKHCSDAEGLTRVERERLRKSRHKKKAEKEIEALERPSFSELDKGGRHKTFDDGSDMHLQRRPNSSLQVKMEAQEQQKAMIRRNAELAKARLASGELQRARDEQIKMHQLYGTVDWRVKKKLHTEKRILERTVAAGKKLASLEEREQARMDAFRVALGLPTAEAQRQAEWRAEATQALNELEACTKHVATASNGFRGSKQGLIGPCLPP